MSVSQASYIGKQDSPKLKVQYIRTSTNLIVPGVFDGTSESSRKSIHTFSKVLILMVVKCVLSAEEFFSLSIFILAD